MPAHSLNRAGSASWKHGFDLFPLWLWSFISCAPHSAFPVITGEQALAAAIFVVVQCQVSLAWLSPLSSTGCLFSCRPRSSRKTALLPPCWPQVLYSTAATQCRLQQWQEARDTLEKAVVWRPEGRSATLALALERVQVRLPLWVPGEVLWAQAEESKIRICRMFYVFGFSCLPTSLVTWWHSKQFLCDALPSFS